MQSMKTRLLSKLDENQKRMAEHNKLLAEVASEKQQHAQSRTMNIVTEGVDLEPVRGTDSKKSSVQKNNRRSSIEDKISPVNSPVAASMAS